MSSTRLTGASKRARVDPVDLDQTFVFEESDLVALRRAPADLAAALFSQTPDVPEALLPAAAGSVVESAPPAGSAGGGAGDAARRGPPCLVCRGAVSAAAGAPPSGRCAGACARAFHARCLPGVRSGAVRTSDFVCYTCLEAALLARHRGAAAAAASSETAGVLGGAAAGGGGGGGGGAAAAAGVAVGGGGGDGGAGGRDDDGTAWSNMDDARGLVSARADVAAAEAAAAAADVAAAAAATAAAAAAAAASGRGGGSRGGRGASRGGGRGGGARPRSPSAPAASPPAPAPPPPPPFRPLKRCAWLVPRARLPRRVEPDACGCSAASGCGLRCANRQNYEECTPATCSLGADAGGACRNRPMSRGLGGDGEPPLRVLPAPGKGHGLFLAPDARAPVAAGDFLIEYVGEVIDAAACVERLAAAGAAGATSFYIMELSEDVNIDAGAAGNAARFANHSCAPNAAPFPVRVRDEMRVGLYATATIRPGEEVTFDYQWLNFAETPWECACRAPGCRGVLGANKKDAGGRLVSNLAGGRLRAGVVGGGGGGGGGAGAGAGAGGDGGAGGGAGGAAGAAAAAGAAPPPGARLGPLAGYQYAPAATPRDAFLRFLVAPPRNTPDDVRRVVARKIALARGLRRGWRGLAAALRRGLASGGGGAALAPYDAALLERLEEDVEDDACGVDERDDDEAAAVGGDALEGGVMAINDGACDACATPGDLLCCEFCPASLHASCARSAAAGGAGRALWACPPCAAAARRAGDAARGVLEGGAMPRDLRVVALLAGAAAAAAAAAGGAEDDAAGAVARVAARAAAAPPLAAFREDLAAAAPPDPAGATGTAGTAGAAGGARESREGDDDGGAGGDGGGRRPPPRGAPSPRARRGASSARTRGH